jgi:hypothetical protein
MNGHGFEVTSAGAPATIQSVQIVGDDTVQITLDDTPSSLNSAVSYAFTANAAAIARRHRALGPAARLRSLRRLDHGAAADQPLRGVPDADPMTG